MSDLVEWLKRQLDEDERVALAATPGPWHEPGPDSVGEWNIYGDGWVIAATEQYPREDMQNYWPKLRKPATVVEHGNENAAHIARHDPARVLHEVEAKRRIMAIHRRRTDVFAESGGAFDNCCDGCGYGGICDDPNIEDINDCPELRILAAIYIDRPGYRAEWAPQ